MWIIAKCKTEVFAIYCQEKYKINTLVNIICKNFFFFFLNESYNFFFFPQPVAKWLKPRNRITSVSSAKVTRSVCRKP